MEVANGDLFKTLKLRQPDRPSVCIFEANPEITPNWELLEVATLMGIYEWETKLNIMYPDGDWAMTVYETIPWTDHQNKTTSDYPHCSIMINFEKENDNSAAIGTTHISFSKSYHKYMFINVYLYHHMFDTDKIIIADGSKGDFKISIGKTELTPNTVRNVVLHEIGHAIGLEHYSINTPLKPHEHGSDRSSMYFSINLNDPNQKLQVRLPEMQMVAQLYGEDGWVDRTPPYNIKECNVVNSIIYDCN